MPSELTYELLSVVGSAASVISLALTFAIFIGVKKIRQFYIFSARVPELNDQLSKIISQISEHLNSFSGSTTKTHELLAQADVSLRALRSKIKNSDLKRSINHALKGIKAFDPPPVLWMRKSSSTTTEQKTRLENIYLVVYKINTQSVEDVKQSHWEK